MRRSNCASALQYVPELTWTLFLRILDAQESRRKEKAEAVGAEFTPALKSSYRWQDWAAPYSDKPSIQKETRANPAAGSGPNSSPPGMPSSPTQGFSRSRRSLDGLKHEKCLAGTSIRWRPSDSWLYADCADVSGTTRSRGFQPCHRFALLRSSSQRSHPRWPRPRRWPSLPIRTPSGQDPPLPLLRPQDTAYPKTSFRTGRICLPSPFESNGCHVGYCRPASGHHTMRLGFTFRRSDAGGLAGR